MVFKGGVKEAAKLLSALDLKQRENVLGLIAQKDPQMAELLKKNMITMEDLCHLSPNDMQVFLRHIIIDDLALVLRKYPEEIKDFFLNNVSSRIKQELLDVFNGPPRPLSKINECEDKILGKVRELVAKGDLVLMSSGNEELV